MPCNVSFEINWASINDNVDIFVCKGNDCVYGGRKRDRDIGQWDSGKSRNRLFGNDLRTNQEAVRQFGDIVPGQYKIYAQLKDSKTNKSSVTINGLIYTKNAAKQERGESLTYKLQQGKSRSLIATIELKKDGNYRIIRP